MVVEDRHHSVLNIHLASILVKFPDRDDVVAKPWDVVRSGEYAMFSYETLEEDRTLPQISTFEPSPNLTKP